VDESLKAAVEGHHDDTSRRCRHDEGVLDFPRLRGMPPRDHYDQKRGGHQEQRCGDARKAHRPDRWGQGEPGEQHGDGGKCTHIHLRQHQCGHRRAEHRESDGPPTSSDQG
jgi:hypothetical protein